jgi:hypothetical protein
MDFGPGTGSSGSLCASLAAKGIAHGIARKRLIAARHCWGIDDHIVMKRARTKKNGPRWHQDDFCKRQGK